MAKYEIDTTKMDYKTLIRFCNLANITIDYFLGRTSFPQSKIVEGDSITYAKDINSPDLTPTEILKLKDFLRNLDDKPR